MTRELRPGDRQLTPVQALIVENTIGHSLRVTQEPDAEDIFSGPVGVFGRTAREWSGGIQITPKDGKYNVSGTRFPLTTVSGLDTVILTSGKADIEINDSTKESPLTVHRVSGTTNLICGDRTAIIISGHSGHNVLDGFIASGHYTSPEGRKYTVIVPQEYVGREQDTSWANRVVRIDQVSGSVNVSKQHKALESTPKKAISGVGATALDAQRQRTLGA